jgi:formyl-CoA transferase
MEGLGLGYEDLKKHNPRIIYATGTGFGASGPLADSRKAGHDTMAQALTGAMSTNAGADGTPRRIPLPVADMTAGNLLVQGILMAFLARQKTGEGQVVEIALLDALLWLQAWHVAGAANPLPSGAAREGSNPLDGGIYHTTDGFIVVTGLFKPNPLADICNVLGIPDLSQDERFSSVPAMVANATELRGLLQAPLQTRITAEWVRDLEAADILAAPILTIDEAIDLPQVAHNQMIVDTRDGNRHVGVPVKLSGTPGSVESAPPRIGEHTSEVLQELGLNKVEIDQLIETGAIAQENGSNR